jgi:tetratricopeptide (TPR) repeat protein
MNEKGQIILFHYQTKVFKSMRIKSIFIGFLLLFSVSSGFTQQQYADSLKQVFSSAKEDSSKVISMGLLSSYYSNLYPDSGLYYADKIIVLSKQNNYKYGEVLGMMYKATAILKQGDFTTSIQIAFKSLNLSKELDEHRLSMLAKSYQLIGDINGVSSNPKQALGYIYKSLDLQKQSGEYPDDFYRVYFGLAFDMLIQEKQDSAFLFLKKGWDFFSTAKNIRNVEPWIVSGNVYRFSGNMQKAEEYFRKGIEMGKKYNSLFFCCCYKQ